MTAHSRIGASSCERWWNCPGSVRAVAAMPPQPPSQYAAEGTAAHALAELCLREGRDAYEMVGQPILGTEYEVTDEMAEAVQMYLDTIRFDMETYDLKVKNILIEHKFHLTDVHEDAFGTNDCCLPIPWKNKVIIYDYKHGKGVSVEAEENKQLMYYALGATRVLICEYIEIVIIQPRSNHRDGPIRRWTLTWDELEAFKEELIKRIEKTTEKNAPLKCGPWCQKSFCPAMAKCPAVLGQVQQDAMVVFSEAEIVTLPKPEDLTPLKLRRLLDGIPLIDAFIKAAWSYAETKANNGEHILGYKLIRGREGNRKWAFSDDVVSKDIQSKVDIDNLAMFESKLKSPAAIEKLVGKKQKKLIDNLTTRTEGKIILVPEDDPREAVSAQVQTVFQDNNSIESLL